MVDKKYRPGGKSYLCVNDDSKLVVNAEYLAGLKERRDGNPESKCTLCLHNDTREKHHEMINLYPKGEYVRPHCHPDKTETKIMLEGKMLVVLFDDKGNITDRIILSPGTNDNFLLRIDRMVVHTNIPLTDVVFYESITGPYTGVNDSVFPAWAPALDDDDAIQEFYARLDIEDLYGSRNEK